MKKIIFILCVVFMLFSCKEDKEIIEQGLSNSITLNVESLAFLNSGEAVEGNNTVIVESSGDWQLIGKNSWCHPSIMNGKNGDTVIFTADVNSEAKSRSTVYSFVCGDKTVKLNVIQKEANVITLYQDEFNIKREGEDLSLRVSSNTDYDYIIPEEAKDWITVVNFEHTHSKDLSVLSLKVSENTTFVRRVADIVFKAEDGSSTVAVISQDRLTKLEAEQRSYSVNNDGGDLSLNVITNLAYQVVVPEESKAWITYAGTNDMIDNPDDLVTVSEHFVISQGEEGLRVGKIMLEALDGSFSVPVVIAQQGRVQSQLVTIPDINFRKALMNLGYIWSEDVNSEQCEVTNIGASATTLDVSGQNIESIEGIEYFPKVIILNCQNNNIKRADLSKNSIEMGDSWYFEGLCGNPLEYVHFAGSKSIDVKLSKDNALNGLTGANGESSTHLIVEGSNVRCVITNGNAMLTDINIYNCGALNGKYCQFSDCAVNGTLNIYVKQGVSLPYLPRNGKIINQDKQDF